MELSKRTSSISSSFPPFHLFTFLTSNHNKCNSIAFANFLFLQFSPKMPNSLLKKKCRIAFNASTHFFSSSPQRVQHAKVTAQEENRLTFVAGLSNNLFNEVFYQVWAGATVLWCTQQKWPCVRRHFEFIISQMIFFLLKNNKISKLLSYCMNKFISNNLY